MRRADPAAWTPKLLLLSFVVLLGLTWWTAAPFLPPLLVAAFLCSVLHRPHRWLEEKLGGRRKTAALISTLLVTAVLVVPLALFFWQLGQEVGPAIDAVRAWVGDGYFGFHARHRRQTFTYAIKRSDIGCAQCQLERAVAVFHAACLDSRRGAEHRRDLDEYAQQATRLFAGMHALKAPAHELLGTEASQLCGVDVRKRLAHCFTGERVHARGLAR